MKNKVTYLLVSLLVLFFSINYSFAQDIKKGGNENSIDSALIIKLENDWTKALINRDEKFMKEVLAKDLIYTENEKMYSRAEVIKSLMSPSEIVESAHNEDLKVHLRGKTGIVTGWLYVNGKSAGASYKRKYRFTDVWYNKKDGWQLIAAQDYLLP